jgi:hypothetical protein
VGPGSGRVALIGMMRAFVEDVAGAKAMAASLRPRLRDTERVADGFGKVPSCTGHGGNPHSAAAPAERFFPFESEGQVLRVGEILRLAADRIALEHAVVIDEGLPSIAADHWQPKWQKAKVSNRAERVDLSTGDAYRVRGWSEIRSWSKKDKPQPGIRIEAVVKSARIKLQPR